jgi:colicin import membrane protein
VNPGVKKEETTMAAKESSVLFSLKELMTLEDERLASEARLAREQAEAHEREAAAIEKRRRDEEQARFVLEERRIADERARERLEAARIEAMREAELEKVRLVAARERDAEALRLTHEHERQTMAMKADTRGRKASIAFLAIGAALVGAALFYVERVAEASRASEIALATERSRLAEQRGARARLESMLESEREQIRRLEERVAAPPPQPSVVANVPLPIAPPSSGKPAHPTPKPTAALAAPCTNRWDPLCGTLP